jgi:hypothetical protein
MLPVGAAPQAAVGPRGATTDLGPGSPLALDDGALDALLRQMEGADGHGGGGAPGRG